MTINSKQKGKRGELEFCSKMKEHGFTVKRSVQYCGNNDDANNADVIGLPGIHCEIKRVEKLNVTDAICQASRDARGNDLPTVFHRKNDEQWLVTMFLDDWVQLYREWGVPF